MVDRGSQRSGLLLESLHLLSAALKLGLYCCRLVSTSLVTLRYLVRHDGNVMDRYIYWRLEWWLLKALCPECRKRMYILEAGVLVAQSSLSWMQKEAFVSRCVERRKQEQGEGYKKPLRLHS